MASTLLGAITDAFGADAALAVAMPGSPWLDEPREGVAFPYTVVTEVREKEDLLDVEGGKDIVSTWAFLVHGTGEADTEAKALLITTALDGRTLVVGNRTLVRMTQVGYRVRLETTRSTDARRVTEVRLDYYAEWRKR